MCETCSLIKEAVAADDSLAIVVPKTAAGAVLVVPRQHGSLSELPQATQQRAFATASSLSSILFEEGGFGGTNIIGYDGEHGHYAVVGRSENDGLELRWQGKRAAASDLAEIGGRISEELWSVGKDRGAARPEQKAEPPRPQSRAEEATPADDEKRTDPRAVAEQLQKHKAKGPKEEKNYLIRHLTRKR